MEEESQLKSKSCQQKIKLDLFKSKFDHLIQLKVQLLIKFNLLTLFFLQCPQQDDSFKCGFYVMKFLDTLFTKYDDLSNIKDTGVSFFYLNLIDIIFASRFFTNFNFFFFNQTFIDNCESYTIDEINEIRNKWATYIQQVGILKDDEDDNEQYFSLLCVLMLILFC